MAEQARGRARTWSNDQIVAWMQDFHEQHGYTPGGRIREQHRGPTNRMLTVAFGTVQDAYKAAGLEPARKRRPGGRSRGRSWKEQIDNRYAQEYRDQPDVHCSCMWCDWTLAGHPTLILGKQREHAETHT